jgi:hypothetical protein
MDFTWTSPTAGDITGVTAGTGLTGGGTSGDVTLTFDQANYGGGQFAAGKNKIINGNFGIWQRGTSFTTSGAYTADRFIATSDATFTVSQQTFTAGTAPVAGYENQYFLQFAKNAGGSYLQLATRLEDVRLFAGQTVTLSAWMRVTSGTASVEPLAQQDFGSGGSGQVNTFATPQTINTTWTRYSFTIAVPSVSGKTIGTSSFLQVYIPRITSGATGAITFQVWGIQLEAGSTATPFQTATGTIQGELAACQRYYLKSYNQATAPATSANYIGNFAYSAISATSTHNRGNVRFPVVMRTTPTMTIYSPGTGTSAKIFNEQVSADVDGASQYIGESGFHVYPTSGTPALGNQLLVHYVASAEL